MTDEEKIERCARAAHNVYVVYCKASGDHSIREWDDAEQWQKDDTIRLVRSVVEGDAIGPEAEHERWATGKRQKGYVWGGVKNDDPAAGPLTNPNLRPYGELPLYVRMKDALLLAVASGMAAHYGLQVRKELRLAFA